MIGSTKLNNKSGMQKLAFTDSQNNIAINIDYQNDNFCFDYIPNESFFFYPPNVLGEKWEERFQVQRKYVDITVK